MKSEFYVIFLKFSKWFFRFFPVSEYHFAYISTFHKKLTWFCGYFPPTFKISLLISRRNLANLAPKLNASLRGSGYTSIDSLAKKPRPYGRCTRIVLEEWENIHRINIIGRDWKEMQTRKSMRTSLPHTMTINYTPASTTLFSKYTFTAFHISLSVFITFVWSTVLETASSWCCLFFVPAILLELLFQQQFFSFCSLFLPIAILF